MNTKDMKMFEGLFIDFIIEYKKKYDVPLDNDEIHGAHEFADFLDECIQEKIITANRLETG
jgi:hypothetical protein